MNKKSIRLGAIVALAGLAMTGCEEEVPFSSVDSETAKSLSSFSASGHAVDGLIKSGTVNVYDFSNGSKGKVLGSGLTDDFGAFSAEIKGVSEDGQYLMACVESGSYTEEASGVEITLSDGDQLCGIKWFEPGTSFDIVINPWSNLAAAKAQHSISKEVPVSDAVSKANLAISSIYGFDILNTVPRDMTDIGQTGQPYDEKMRMGNAIAGISQLVLNSAKDVGVDSHNEQFSSIKLHQIMYNDIITDGVLNGIGMSNDGNSTITLGLGNTLFDRETFTKDLALSSIQFVRSEKNKTDITSDIILIEQDRIASSTNESLFPPLEPGAPVPSLDSLGPVVDFDLTENAYIESTLDITGSVSDFSGIKSLAITVGNVSSDLSPSEIFTHSVNTNAIPDGPLEITVVATDNLDNVSTTSITLNVANSQPVSNITSTNLVGSASYDFVAEVSNYPQGIDTILVNGTEAAIDEFGEVTASIILNEGANTVTMTINDSIGQSFDYTYVVNVDLSQPDIALGLPYDVYKKNPSQAEPVLSPIAFSVAGDPLFVSPFTTALNGTAVEVAGLKSLKWPMLEFTAIDPSIDDEGTENNNLSVQYTYKQDGSEVLTRTLTSLDLATGQYAIPFSDEFLGSGWYNFDGTHSIDVVVTDDVGNSSILTKPFLIYKSIPEITTTIDINTNLGGDSAIFDFTTTDFTGMDEVVLIVDGVEYRTTDVFNPEFSVDLTQLTNGPAFATLLVYKDGVQVSSQRIDFSVDNTGVELTVPASTIINQSSYTVAGTAIDNESGVAMVTVNGSAATYNLSDDSYTKAFTGLIDGIHEFIVEAINGLGVVTTESTTVSIDTTYPLITGNTPLSEWINTPSFAFSGNCEDPLSNGFKSGIANLTIDGVNVPCVGGGWSHAVTKSTGEHTIPMQITDVAGNSTLINKTMKVDTISPTLTSNQPASEWIKTNSFTFSGACSDSNSGVASLTVDGNSVSCSSNSWSKSLSPGNGSHNVSIQLIDNAGNTTALSKNLKIDTAVPQVSFDPVPSNVKDSTYTLTGNCSDTGSGVSILNIKGSLTSCVGTDWSKSVSLSQGNNAISATISDVAGNTASSSLTVFRDSLAPNIVEGSKLFDSFLIDTDGTTNIFSEYNYEYNFSVQDSSGVHSVELISQSKTYDYEYVQYSASDDTVRRANSDDERANSQFPLPNNWVNNCTLSNTSGNSYSITCNNTVDYTDPYVGDNRNGYSLATVIQGSVNTCTAYWLTRDVVIRTTDIYGNVENNSIRLIAHGAIPFMYPETGKTYEACYSKLAGEEYY